MTSDDIRAMDDGALTVKIAELKGWPILDGITRGQKGYYLCPNFERLLGTPYVLCRNDGVGEDVLWPWDPVGLIADAWPLWEELPPTEWCIIRRENGDTMVSNRPLPNVLFDRKRPSRAMTEAYAWWKMQEEHHGV